MSSMFKLTKIMTVINSNCANYKELERKSIDGVKTNLTRPTTTITSHVHASK